MVPLSHGRRTISVGDERGTRTGRNGTVGTPGYLRERGR